MAAIRDESACTCGGYARPGEPAVFDNSKCPIHSPKVTPALVPGTRCEVTDLRHGTTHLGVVVEVRPDDKVVVRYDSGAMVAVGRSFVKVEVPDAR